MVGALGYRLHQNLICSARHGRRRRCYHGIGIAQESRTAAMDPGIRYLLAMALAMVAELSAKLSATMLAAGLSLMMLVNVSVVLP